MTERGDTGAARALLVGVVLVALFAFFFVYPGHDPQPNGAPVGLGEPAGGARAMLEDAGFEVVPVRSLPEAREMIADREVYGAVMPGQVIVATAASPQIAQILTRIGELSARRSVDDVRPLSPDDPRGTTINLLVVPIAVTSILGAMLLFTLAPGLPGRERAALLALFGLLGALAAMLVVRVGIGALPGSLLALIGVTALAMTAIATVSAALMRAAGPAGVGLSFLLFLMLAAPASGAATAPEMLPGPWSWAGQLMPPGALATGIRNVAYFDAANAAGWLTVLLVWAAAGVALLLRPGRSRQPAAAA